MNKAFHWLSLFASTSTLLCCALPSLLVFLGLGATMAGLLSNFPQIIWFSQYKAIVFGGSGILIALSTYWHFQSKNLPCPIDPDLAQACKRSQKWSFRVLLLSIILWSTGAFFAFLAPIIFF